MRCESSFKEQEDRHNTAMRFAVNCTGMENQGQEGGSILQPVSENLFGGRE